MDEARSVAGTEALVEISGDFDQTSGTYVGRWNRLITTTNWEKGRIISEWRDALIAAQAPPAEYSDDAWARRVGGVSGQHTGRLRRVYTRFGEAHDKYPGLYWSHFQAAIDWDDAEMWLEGAVQSDWSVLQMRSTRWETLSPASEAHPREGEVLDVETDEDFEPPEAAEPDEVRQASSRQPDDGGGPLAEGPDFGDDEPADDSHPAEIAGPSIYSNDDERETVKFVRPFAHLPDLPDDLAEAFETLKLAVLRHKALDWEQISCDDVLASLDALKELVTAPSPEQAPF